jgi:hypothetical protein
MTNTMRTIAFVASTFLFQNFSAGQDVLLVTLGHMSGHAMYTTYIAVGAIADGHANTVYDNEYTRTLLTEQSALCTSTVAQLQLLQDSGEITAVEDKSYVLQMMQAFKGLATQADLYVQYIDNTEMAGAYEEQRLANWERIKAALGLE